MANEHLSRRNFLKATSLAVGGSILVGCGARPKNGPPPEKGTDQVDTPSLTFGEGNPADQSVLIAYATYAGSTLEIASALGEELATRGFRVDLMPMKDDPPAAGYQAVLIGSPVQYGEWLPEAIDYVNKNHAVLNKNRLAMFTVHITNLGDDAASETARQGFIQNILSVLQPETHVFFAGKFDARGAALLLPGIIAKNIPVMDQRDWKKIRAWGKTLFS